MSADTNLAKLAKLDPAAACIDLSSVNKAKPSVRAVTLQDFLAMDIPPRNNLLTPWLPEQGLCMVYARPGIGKTFFSLNVAYAVASGGSFLGWDAPTAKGVLFIDGEMSAVVLQERLAAIVASSNREPQAPIKVITPDLQEHTMSGIDLSSLEHQEMIRPHLEGMSLIVVDNISTLCGYGRENEAEGWIPMQQWALKMRSEGKSVLFVHHAGKGGAQRGTSKREDVLDTIIELKRPADYEQSDGAKFELHYTKSRGFCGDDAAPMNATLVTQGDIQTWATSSLEESTFDQVVELLNEGLSQTDIAKELEKNKSTISRHARKAKEDGLVREAKK